MTKIGKYRRLNTKIILMFTVMIFVMVIAIGFVIYTISYRRVLDNVYGTASGTGEFAAAAIDPDNITNWLENGSDSGYTDTAELLTRLNQYHGLNSIYVFKPMFDDSGNMINNMLTVFDVSRDGDISAANSDMLGVETGEVDVFEECKTVYSTRRALQNGIVTKSDEFGWLSSCYVPILDKKGNVCAFVGIDSQMTVILDTVLRETLMTCGIIFLLIAAFAVIFILFIRNSVVKPVKLLSENMNTFVSGTHGENGEKVLNFTPITGIKTHDEIEQMSEDFNSMAKSLMDYTYNLEKSTAERERLQADLDVAAQIRVSLSNGIADPDWNAQPDYSLFPDRTDFELFASMKNTVFNKSSFCDCFMTDENHLFMVVGESPGRSLASMLNVMLAATNIRCFAQMGYRPYRIAMETNNLLCGQGDNDKGLAVNVIVAEVDLTSGIMRYVNAGMPPVLLKKTGEKFAYDIAARQFSLGEMIGISYSQETVRLSQGNSVIMMSGGVPEMFNENGVEFGETKVEAEINGITAREYALRNITEELENSLDKFRGAARLESDTSLIAFRYFG